MFAVRRLLVQRRFVVLLCAVTLVLKLLVPTGYMIGNDHGRATLELCSGMVAQPVTMAMPAMQGDMSGHDQSQHHGKAEQPCAFAGLSAAALGTIDPVQFVALIAFIMVIGLSPVVLPTIVRRGYLRPPLRGPPRSL